MTHLAKTKGVYVFCMGAPRFRILVRDRGGSRILVRGPSGVLTQGGPEPKICSKLLENCMILKKSWGQGVGLGSQGPLDPLVREDPMRRERG